MEEADSLSQYIGIMAAGQMRAIGTRQRLKQRYATGYRLQIIHTDDKQEDVDDMVLMSTPLARLDRREPIPSEQNVIRSFYIIPPQNPIQFIYESCEEAKTSNRIKEFGLEFTSLEEIFLTIAQLVEPPEEYESNLLSM